MILPYSPSSLSFSTMQGEDRHCQIRRRLHLTVGVVKGYCGHGRNFFWNPPSLSRFVQSTHTSPILWVPPKQRRPAHLSHSQAPEVPASAQPVGEVVHWTMRSQPYRPTDRALESPFPRPSSFPVQRGEDDILAASQTQPHGLRWCRRARHGEFTTTLDDCIPSCRASYYV